jgi:hypothetical protein
LNRILYEIVCGEKIILKWMIWWKKMEDIPFDVLNEIFRGEKMILKWMIWWKKMEDIPFDVLNEIFLYVDSDTHIQCRAVCKRWQTHLDTFYKNMSHPENTKYHTLIGGISDERFSKYGSWVHMGLLLKSLDTSLFSQWIARSNHIIALYKCADIWNRDFYIAGATIVLKHFLKLDSPLIYKTLLENEDVRQTAFSVATFLAAYINWGLLCTSHTWYYFDNKKFCRCRTCLSRQK